MNSNNSILKHKLDGSTGDRLGQLYDSPLQLFFRGTNPNELLNAPAVAIVGSRKMSAYGKAITEKLASDLARAGVVIISGLALGVDSAAHRMALESGTPTIAVLAGGLDSIHPSSHLGLARSIVEQGGSLISEYTEGMPPLAHQFIARNRIIAALADTVLVTEAALKSGSLHTADFALDLGKPVCAVPGPITSSTSQGTNQLLKNGAHVITCAQDILGILGVDPKPARQQSFFGISPGQMKVLSLMQSGVNNSEDLYGQARLSESDFAQALSMLEINGYIRAAGGNYWQLL